MKQLAQIILNRPEEIGAYIPLGSSDSAVNLGFWISRAIQYSIIIAGLIFFVKLILAGFTYLTSTGDSGKIQEATKEITNALIGLLLVVSVFFIKQILETVFGIKIL